MNLSEFAQRYRLKVSRDRDGTSIVLGRPAGSHIYEYGEGELGVMLMPDSSRRWAAARRAFTRAGLRIRQNADCEGAASFDPTNPDQAKLALKCARVRHRRRASEKQLSALEAGRRPFATLAGARG